VVKEAFGVDSSQLDSTVIRDLNLFIHPGEVVLVTGASGSGKSTLLKPISQKVSWIRKRMKFRGRVFGVTPKEVAELTTVFQSNRPLIDQVCKGRDVRHAIELLNSVGLAEAHLYLKRPNQISDGQRYRFAVARLCDSGKPVWVADEFTSTLSPEVAAVVAKGLRRLAMKYGTTVVLAAPHVGHFADSIVPNKLIRLSWGGHARVHAVHAVWNSDSSRVRLALRNESEEVMTRLTIDSLDLRGGIIRLRCRGKLPPNAVWRVSVKKTELRRATALRAYCDQGVGDIAYIERH
jgi:hypothetical protein